MRRLDGVLRVTRRRVREAAPYKGGRCLDGGGGKPPPYMTGGHMGPPLQRGAESCPQGNAYGRPQGSPLRRKLNRER